MIDDKAVMQQALDWMLNHGGIVFAGGGMNAVDPMNKVAQDLRKAIVQPVEPHDLQKRLEALDFYEDIAEHYARCAISPEALRDWVAERMDMPAIAQPAHKSIASDAIECVAQSVQPADKNRVLNGLRDAFMQTAPGAVLMAIGNALQYIDSLDITIVQPVTQTDLEHVFETLYDHGNGKYRGAVSKAQRDKAIAICEALEQSLAQPATQHNFCPRCGKRLAGIDDIHTCSAPMVGV